MNQKTKPDQKKIKQAKRLSERYLRNSGEYYLNRFPASSDHFLTVMTRKIDKSCRDHPDQDRGTWIAVMTDQIIPHFQALGFLNDELYASAVFRSLKNRGFSAAKIRSKMREKDIPKHLVEAQFETEEFDEAEAVIRFAEKKKIGRFRLMPYADEKQKQRDLGKLARAGFSYGTAMRVFEAES